MRNVGDVVFVVVSYERAGGATNINLWVNPPMSSLGSNAPPAATASVPQGSAANDLNAHIAYGNGWGWGGWGPYSRMPYTSY